MVYLAVFLLITTFVFARIPIKIDLFLRLKKDNECVLRISLFFIEIFHKNLFKPSNDSTDLPDMNLQKKLFSGGIIRVIELKYLAYKIEVGNKDNSFQGAITFSAIKNAFGALSEMIKKAKNCEIKRKSKFSFDENVIIIAARAIISVSFFDVIFCLCADFLRKKARSA